MPIVAPIESNKISKADDIWNYSNPKIVSKKAKEYLGKDAKVYRSTRKDKKYMVRDDNDKWVHFGAMYYTDFTKHKDENRKERYLKRATNIKPKVSSIKGDWRENKYSPNNMSINILW